MKQIKFFLKSVICVTIVPFIEILLVHLYIRGFYSQYRIALNDFLFLLGAALFFIYRINEDKPVVFKIQKEIVFVNILFFLLFIFVALYPFEYSWLVLLFSSLITIGSSFFVCLNPELLRKYSFELFFTAFAGTAKVFHTFYSRKLWAYLSNIVTQSVIWLMHLFNYKSVHTINPNTIKHNDIVIEICHPCSGLEGIFFFIIVFSIIMILEGRSYSKVRVALGFISGVLLMFILNILRITIFFMICIWLTKTYGSKESAEWMAQCFHGNVGWILYMIGIIMFFIVWYSFKEKKTQINY